MEGGACSPSGSPSSWGLLPETKRAPPVSGGPGFLSPGEPALEQTPSWQLPLRGASVLGLEAPEDGTRPFRVACPKGFLPKRTSPGRPRGGRGRRHCSRPVAVCRLVWEGERWLDSSTCTQVMGFATGIIQVRVQGCLQTPRPRLLLAGLC